MRSPEHRNYTNRSGPSYDNEPRNKTPEAFTVLPPENDIPPEPPLAPQPYRLTPSSRRHKNMSFAILAEPGSAPGSRSPSPTGRVSPFRGRGFNPAGSRHASPVPSPPPQEAFTTLNDSPRHSKIPRLSRRGSAAAFGEKITDYQSSPNRRKLNAQLSQSLTNIAPARVSSRPPPSPRRTPSSSKVAFSRLSPIVGSSPEPSQSQSSPKNTSSHQNKFQSPNRSRSFVNRPPRNPSKKIAPKNASREPSPSKNPVSPTRIPVKNSYKNVQAKVNSFNRTKPKVPPKPQVLCEETTEESDAGTNRRRMVRRDSVASRTNSKSNLYSNNNTKSNKNGNTVTKNKQEVTNSTRNVDTSTTTADEMRESEVTTEEEQVVKKSESTVKLSDLLQPSTTAVVSSTTTTVTQPLKIEARIDPEVPLKSDNKSIAPMVDGRVLSATSISNALNKMNDTVVNTQTLIKESGLTKLSPAASTIIAMSNESKHTNPALDTKNATTALPKVEEIPGKTLEQVNTNHISSTGIIPSARVLEEHVQNNMSKLISPEVRVSNNITKSANDRIIEARTVVAHDVKPIKITVKEKPMDVEVQSGNVRFETVNGITERPGLPPPNQPSNEPQQEQQEPPKSNPCSQFFSACKKKMLLKKDKTELKETAPERDESKEKTGCFNCRKKKPDVTINIEEDPNEPKKKFWERMKYCGKNKVSDNSGCFPTGRRKGSWVGERRDSILSELPAKKSKCAAIGGFFGKIFCLNKCKKKKKPKLEEIQESRRASTMSKKKSLTPSIPPEDTTPKIDESLVDHTSTMKAAIPVLPVSLAWFCLVMNCIAPGTGTVLSGLFCLCIGKPRFSQKDGMRQRIWSFIINIVIGFGQFFTILFCLVGWGWSIWWGVIMVRIAKKHRKIKALEENAQGESRLVPAQNHSSRDPERGS